MAGDETASDRGTASFELRAAMRRARLNEAERSDVIVDLRAAEIVRLEVLAEQLAPVIAALPAHSDLIDCQVVTGHPPRLWIDMLGFVEMAHDKRTYELISESRSGRQTLFRSESVAAMAHKVTDYIAHRLVERERMAAGARPPIFEPMPQMPAAAPVATPQPEPTLASQTASEIPPQSAGAAFWQLAFAFLLGVIFGIVAMLVMGLIATA